MRKILVGFILSIVFMTTVVSAESSLPVDQYMDFKSDEYWTPAVTWAVERGIMNGYVEEKLLKPYNPLTQAQYMAMLTRFLAKDELADANAAYTDSWASGVYYVANRYNLFLKDGLHDGTLNQPITRGDTAKLLAEAVSGKRMTQKDAIQWLYDNNLSTGYKDESGVYPKTYASYRPHDTLKRAQGVVFLFRYLQSGLPQTIQHVKVHDALYELGKDAVVTIGMTKQEVDDKLGEAQRVTTSEIGYEWYTYHENYRNFIMVGMLDERVVATYTPSVSMYSKVAVGLTIQDVEDFLLAGKGTYTGGFKDKTYHANEDQSVFLFYDKHEDYKLTGVFIEKTDMGRYSDYKKDIQDDFELQVFDITNAIRKEADLATLEWDGRAKESAYAHSLDMALNQYFAHTNLDGLSPFDRMKAEGIHYRSASENIAAGYRNAVFVVEGWMNSSGHRKNILSSMSEYLGVGVAFTDQGYQYYYTQNFFSK
ncbi:hypothetical protein EJF36_18770 [Bacillus sp. HMF5848]|uniref:CAP domain-containing protein n=1 Tax=Bacillus sp. HMF5848 TaxID=2495421 RepID=UPI000F76E56F|nr:CAP domain-containing protein [Bacillus sp. HMF5848]RSK23935.1 hypothetical protein EJF36_21265 [Bacillus sp. HMF5848]RSK28750.1 hypothetical protein EJF36_18770 [Bacillus sp. HMF5848]